MNFIQGFSTFIAVFGVEITLDIILFMAGEKQQCVYQGWIYWKYVIVIFTYQEGKNICNGFKFVFCVLRNRGRN